jgi:CRP-like cAMP-binding protein
MEREITDSLTQCPLFRGLRSDEIQGILNRVDYKVVNYSAKDVYVLAGMPCKYADIIIEGEMVARMVGLSGKLVQIDHLRKGTLVAPAFIFSKENAMPVSVETSQPTQILRMMPSELKRLIDTDPQIRMNFILLLSNIDVFLTNKLRILSLFTVREKVAYFLIKAAERQKSRVVTLDKTRQEIADSFGIQKFSLLRCLSEFEDLGAIKIEGKKITILNSDKMKG